MFIFLPFTERRISNAIKTDYLAAGQKCNLGWNVGYLAASKGVATDQGADIIDRISCRLPKILPKMLLKGDV